ncbi:MAG: selenium cofactor biosynthesis protein YqeC [Oscillospiraceae bacterium]|nr:selenium cofactor biosynthesis protein YqeC [Oscillospiraceae bacterium]
MRILVKNGGWTETESLSDALGQLVKPFTRVAFVGSGGKTSIMMRLAEEQKEKNKIVLVLTTTHMYRPERYGIFTGNVADIENALMKDGIAVAGKETEGGKISWPGDGLYHQAKAFADIVLIEADGSKRLPLKFPNCSEPVIPTDTDIILPVLGLGALGCPGKEVCHRWDLARMELAIQDEHEILTTGHLCLFMREGYLKPLKKEFPSACIIPIFNQADTETLVDAGKRIIDELGAERGIVSSMLPL